MVPSSCRERILELLHGCHLGIVRMKQMARRYVYWRGMDDDVERFVRGCRACNVTARTVTKKKKVMRSTDAQSVIDVLVALFLVFGYCDSIVSDNGPPFGSEMFGSWAKWLGIKLIKSPSYNPESNGQAE